MGTIDAQEVPEETTFILHKLLFDFEKMPASLVNDGHINEEYADFKALAGAEFEVYDVTKEFEERLKNNETVTEIRLVLAQLDLSTKSPILSGTTDVNGEVEFTLETSSVTNKVYLFHESSVPAGVKERATNIVVLLPFYDDVNGDYLSTVHLYPKNESENLPFEKEVIGNISYEIGERITYEIRTRIPENPMDYDVFRISDTADSVLEFYPDTLTVRVGETSLNPGVTFTQTQLANGFNLEFHPDLLTDYRGQELVIRYEMALNEEAIADVNYLNEGKLEYDNNVLIAKDMVRTGGYRFVKVDVRNQNITLPDAHFILRNSNNQYLMIDDGRFNWVIGRGDATEFVSDDEGLFSISGLKYGTYYLEETKAPFRYILSEEAIAFNVMYGTYHERAIMNVVNQRERPRLPITGGDPEPVTQSRPNLPITRGDEPIDERPRLPITGEGLNRLLGAFGIVFIGFGLVMLSNEDRKRGKNK